MTRVPLAALAITVVVGGVAGARQIFRASTDMVLLSVTAIDAAGHPAPNLKQSDFRVFEDGIPQTIVAFSKDPQPIALSLLLDSSTSMEPKLAVATQAAIGFCQRLGPNDVAQVIAFNNDTQILQPFTRDLPALERAIRQVTANGATSLYTAVYVALNELARVKAASADAIRRQGLVVLSDGEDNASVLSDEDVLDLAKRSTVAIYAIGLRERRKKDEPPRGVQSDYVLRNLSQTTGGRVFFVDDPAQLPAIYTQIADELASQYTVGYVSTNARRDGAWRRIAVRVAQSGVSARTKLGYYGPTGSTTER
ncbi:MAG TPA: VWA domain-containing protein [Vicinamibacterales bacterium]|nr:VWA domain-containing protein [Vicinamibacterales bacterium]